jgi:Protein of unknown function (DUF2971)
MPSPGAHLIFRSAAIPPETKIWRYLTFAKFASLLESSKLHFTRADQFDDHFEGAWPKKDLQLKADLSIQTDHFRPLVAVSCWVELAHESAAMWRLYAPGHEGVAIATSFGKIRSLMETVEGHFGHDPNLPFPLAMAAGAARVKYLDHFTSSLFEELKDQGPTVLSPFMVKSISYQHENEVRALIAAHKGRMLREGVDTFRVILITVPF